MPNVAVKTEVETDRGWSFRVAVREDDAAPASEHELLLSWVDYEHWTHGLASPSRVAEVVVTTVRDAKPDLQLPPKFDASTCRRWVRDLDARVREAL